MITTTLSSLRGKVAMADFSLGSSYIGSSYAGKGPLSLSGTSGSQCRSLKPRSR